MTGRPHGYRCDSCGEFHNELPMALTLAWPRAVQQVPEDDREARVEHDGDWCVLDGERWFVRGCLELPVPGVPQGPFVWGVWVELAGADFGGFMEAWEREGRESAPPLLGRLANELPSYPQTLDLPVHLHTRPAGVRPLIELPPTDHALAVEQHQGISLERVHELVDSCL